MAEQNEEKEPEQIALMRRMVELSVVRTEMAADRSKMSADRSEMSAERSRMSADRSEMSAERTYLNAERTLSVWVRTALSLMIFGIAIDRFGLFLNEMPDSLLTRPLHSNELSNWLGVALTVLGVMMVLTTGVRFLAYARSYRRAHTIPDWHGPYLAPFFAFMVAIFGVAVLVILMTLAD